MLTVQCRDGTYIAINTAAVEVVEMAAEDVCEVIMRNGSRHILAMSAVAFLRARELELDNDARTT